MSDMIYCGAKDDCAGNNKGKSCPSGYSCKEGNCVEGCLDGQVLCDVKCITPETDMIYCGASDDCTGNNKGKTCPSGYSCKEGNCVEGCLDGQVLCDGKCITPETDMIYCGASDDCTGNNKGKTCPSGTSCQDGTCEAGCIEGQVLCDGKCITPGTDMSYCGASGDCSGQNKGTTCQSGTSCQGGTCETGCIDGQLLCDGKCITPGTDMIYCGASGDCSGKNKGTTCQSGTSCQGGTCETGCISGQVLCDGKCITPGTDMIYCGASGDCTGDNKGKTCPSGTSCQGGTCEAGCVSGQVLCDGKCITPGTDMNFCGASGDCTGQNKGKTCPSGTSCQGGTCEAGCVSGQVLCDGKCITPGTDMIYCGASGNCSGQNKGKTCPSGTSCQGGTCEAGCVSGQVLCDGKCITPGTDMIYCGASGNCSGRNKGTTCPSGTSCQGGTCEAGCVSGQVLCDGKCITPGTDMIYCGASGDCTGRNKGTTCPSGTSCQGGTCEAGCIDGQLLCDGKCITPGTDMIYCGASGDCTGRNKGTTCPSGTSCQGGTCEAGCVSGQVLCDGKCITPGTDMIYCGASGDCTGQNKGKTCPSGTSCQGGRCEAGCVSGQVQCDGKCITPGTDMIYCGASGNCSGQNKGKTCPSGTSCQGGTCEAGCIDGQLLCDGKCITPGTDMIYCGASGDCSGQNKGRMCPSGTSCQGGRCEAGCVSGQVLCDGKCITPGTDMIYCGASGDCTGQNKGRTCPSGTSCQGGICEVGCVSGQVLCDGKCITPTTDMIYCGAKGACNATDASSSNYKGQACVNGKVCVNGACVQNSCTGTLTLCATQAVNQCIDIKGNDANHCGACNYKCSEHRLVNASSTSCSAGECQYACTGTYVNVGTGNTASTIYCINPASDNLYCGATGMDNKGETCSSELKCMGGKCVTL